MTFPFQSVFPKTLATLVSPSFFAKELTQQERNEIAAKLVPVVTMLLDDSMITQKGTTYGLVTSPYTAHVWLDRNLGASRVCTAFDDMACFGDYYQQGRNTDGHKKSGSTTTTTLATYINSVGGSFITNTTTPYDWASVDSSGSQRSTNQSKTNGSSICPVGFRVPSVAELRVATLDQGATDRDKAFTNFLKLPSAGVRFYDDGSINYVGLGTFVWSSSANNFKAVGLSFRGGGASSDDVYRTYGTSVRCIKDQIINMCTLGLFSIMWSD